MNDTTEPQAREQKTYEVAAPRDIAPRRNLPFPVVGIGASAGGLEAGGAARAEATLTNAVNAFLRLHRGLHP